MACISRSGAVHAGPHRSNGLEIAHSFLVERKRFSGGVPLQQVVGGLAAKAHAEDVLIVVPGRPLAYKEAAIGIGAAHLKQICGRKDGGPARGHREREGGVGWG